MESNSRDFASRVRRVNANTRAVCQLLQSHSLSYVRCMSHANTSHIAIKEVFYPEFITPENYGACRRSGMDDNFGPLFSLSFVSLDASKAFFDALQCAKGPSLGTNFTLACPYTILAHFRELKWAAQYGVDEGLVRVSVGMEDKDLLLEWFARSIKAAEDILRDSLGANKVIK